MSWVVVFCGFLGLFCLIVGVMIGMAWGEHLAKRDQRARRADAEADRFIGELRETTPEAMARQRHPVVRSKRTSTAAFLDSSPIEVAAVWDVGRDRLLLPADIAHEAWLAHEEQALALTRPESESDEEFSARLRARTDRFIASIQGGEQ